MVLQLLSAICLPQEDRELRIASPSPNNILFCAAASALPWICQVLQVPKNKGESTHMVLLDHKTNAQNRKPKRTCGFFLIGKPKRESTELHPSAKAYERIYCECFLQDSFLVGDSSFGIPLHDIANPIYSKFMMHIPQNTKMTFKTQCRQGALLVLQ